VFLKLVEKKPKPLLPIFNPESIHTLMGQSMFGGSLCTTDMEQEMYMTKMRQKMFGKPKMEQSMFGNKK